MASRQTAGTLSTNQYVSGPAQFASQAQQQDINLSNQSGNPKLSQMNSGGRGTSNTASSQILPILPPNATPSTSGITESGTTVTVTLGNPHGLTIGTSGQTITVATGVGGYNGTFTVTAVPTAYSLQYTAGSSGLTSPTGLGTVTLLGGSSAALLPFQPALNGATIAGSVTGTLEIWGDNAIWDTTNSRYISASSAGFDPANLQ